MHDSPASPLPLDSTAGDRRSFIKTVSLASLGLGLASTPLASAAEAATGKKTRYAIVGVGSRGMTTYQDAVLKYYQAHAEVVALCDTNAGRLELGRQFSLQYGAPEPRLYAAADFDRMLREVKPDYVIVTTTCGTHSNYVVRAMDAGCDVICEKALATTAEQCQAIIDARARTGRTCRVTFNVRYEPQNTQLKEILMRGDIGDILSVDMNWMLDTYHGADYFRRWHAHKVNSGGLIVHKATHHFDFINWLIGATPATVLATGKREFYTPAMAKRFGLSGPHERCLTCPETAKCAFYLDLNKSPENKRLYLDNEKYDGYIRDRCVFRPEIDIEDNMNLLVTYDNGITFTYSLNAFCSWEGYRIAFNGTKGRLEHSHGRPQRVMAANGKMLSEGTDTHWPVTRTTFIPLRGAAVEIEPTLGKGTHGGSDKIMLDDLFLPNPPADPYLRAADERAGIAAVLMGAAANEGFVSRTHVDLSRMVKGLKPADFPAMPSRTGQVPMPLAKT